MDEKKIKIEFFLDDLEKTQLENPQLAKLLVGRGGMPGTGGPAGPPGVNNCGQVNCAENCGDVLDQKCKNMVYGCGL